MSDRGQRSGAGGQKSGGKDPEPGTRNPEPSKGRTTAEWVTLAVSISIVLALVGLVTYQYIVAGNNPPAITVEPKLGEVRIEGDRYYLPVDLTNTGDTIAEDVSVELTLTPAGGGEAEAQSATLGVAFLPGGETAQMVAVFSEDPSAGELEQVIAFRVP